MSVVVHVEPAPAAKSSVQAPPEAPAPLNAPGISPAVQAPTTPSAAVRAAPSEPPAEAPHEVTVATTDGGVEYLPSAMLSEVPFPERPLSIPYPLDSPELGRFSTVLALFIDESGSVRRVRLDGPPLPPALDAAARAAFMGVRWKPGELTGRPVKSVILVEVTFENGQETQTGRLLE